MRDGLRGAVMVMSEVSRDALRGFGQCPMVPKLAMCATMRQSGNAERASGSGSIAVAGAKVASTPSVSSAVSLSHISRFLKMLAAAAASRLL